MANQSTNNMEKYTIPPEEYATIRRETDEAVERGYDHAKAEWKMQALDVLYNVCRTMQEFTVNDFREQVKQLEAKTHDNRAMGGLMNTAKRLGWIESSGKSIPSRVGHLVPIAIWRSKIFDDCTTPMRPKHQPKIDHF